MLFPDLPPPGPTSPVTVACVQQAAATYGIPEALILAVLETEGGRPGLARRNRDGSHDLGPMQVNTRWVRREGLNARDLRDHGCYNLHVGTAILARELRAAPDLATGVGNYHSRTPRHHQRYQRLIVRSLKRLLAGMGRSAPRGAP
jgi:hypothetical protein